jgi:pilus assembly protein CpaB
MKSIGGKGVLALSLVLGIATSYMVYQYVDQAGQAAKPIQTVAVVTATQEIPVRTAITGDMLRVMQVPVAVKVPQAISSPADVTGKVTKLPISQGEQVLGTKLFGDRDQSGLAFVVPEGKRAVAVPVDEVVGSGGMIVPGDDVDVVAVLDTDTQTAADTSGKFGVDPSVHAQIKSLAQMVLQNVEVLAVAQTLEGDPPPQSTTQKAANAVSAGKQSAVPPNQPNQIQPSAHTVTVAVAPEDAEKLILAGDKGHIQLVLRAHGDDTTIQVDDGLFSNLNGAAVLKTEPKPL